MNEQQADPQALVIAGDRVPVAAYQAIYHRLTKKTEVIERGFTGCYNISRESVQSLAERLEQSLRQYHIKGYRAEISVSLSGNENYVFSSLEKFLQMDFSTISRQSERVVVEIDFLVVLPVEILEAENIPQRYRVRVEILQPGAPLKRELIDPLGRVSAIFSALQSPAIVTRIEYADFAVALNLQSIISDWADSLEFDDEASISDETGEKIDKWGDRFTVSLPFVGAISAIIFETNDYSDIMTPARYLLAVLLTTALLIVVAIELDSRKSQALSVLSPRSLLSLTAKDVSVRNALVKRRSRAKGAIAFVFSAVLLSFAIGVSANIVAEWLAKLLV